MLLDSVALAWLDYRDGVNDDGAAEVGHGLALTFASVLFLYHKTKLW